MGGVGIRSQAEINPTAFIGGLEQALPHFIVAGGVCQQLAGQDGLNLYEVAVNTTVRLQDRQGAFSSLDPAEYLGQEQGGAQAVPVEGAGEGSVDGSASQEVCCAVKRGVKGCSV